MHELRLLSECDDVGVRLTEPGQALFQDAVHAVDQLLHLLLPMQGLHAICASRFPKHACNLFGKLRDDCLQLFVPMFIPEVGQAQRDPVHPMMSFQQLQTAMVGIAVRGQELLLLARGKVADLENTVNVLRRDRGRIGGIRDLRYEAAILAKRFRQALPHSRWPAVEDLLQHALVGGHVLQRRIGIWPP